MTLTKEYFSNAYSLMKSIFGFFLDTIAVVFLSSFTCIPVFLLTSIRFANDFIFAFSLHYHSVVCIRRYNLFSPLISIIRWSFTSIFIQSKSELNNNNTGERASSCLRSRLSFKRNALRNTEKFFRQILLLFFQAFPNKSMPRSIVAYIYIDLILLY